MDLRRSIPGHSVTIVFQKAPRKARDASTRNLLLLRSVGVGRTASTRSASSPARACWTGGLSAIHMPGLQTHVSLHSEAIRG